MADKSNSLIFYVNGKKIIEQNPDPEVTLLQYLRTKLYLSGTKLACGEGGCGACTVMVSKFDRQNDKIVHLAVNACLAPICSMHGLAVTTVEGIGSTKTKLHPAQERIAKSHGSQCGFCTPGFVMSMYTLLRNTPQPDMEQLLKTFQGNLCRCTGYRPIIDGYRSFTKEYQNGCPMGENCCKVSNKNNEVKDPLVDDKLFEASKFAPYDQSQEPIFPPELKLNQNYDKESLYFSNARGVVWYRPTTLKDLVDFKQKYPEAKIVNGNTEVGVEVKFKKMEYFHLVNPSLVEEMNKIEFENDGIRFGAAVTLTKLDKVLEQQIEKLPKHETRLYKEIVDMLHWFGGEQIRNVASIGGNVMTASPISDLNPIFLAANVELAVVGTNNKIRKVKMTSDFFKGYRKTVLEPTDILVSVFIPKTKINQYFIALKQSKRREDDISIVVSAFNVIFKEHTDEIEEMQLAFGGLAPITMLATKTQKAVKGLKWDRNIIEIVQQNLIEEISLKADAPGGMVLYRRSLAPSLFFKAYLKISQELQMKFNRNDLIADKELHGIENFGNLHPKSKQTFERVSEHQRTSESLRRPIITTSSIKQATGEALYVDDIPKYENELYLAIVFSTKAHAKVLSIDPSEALKTQGVQAFYSGKDISDENNKVGLMVVDDFLFVKDVTTAEGQIIGLVVADTKDIAQRAARLVKVEYEELTPIITCEQAIEHKSFFPGYPKIFIDSDITKAFETADKIIEGTCRLASQEHFYMETQGSLAIPKDSEEIEIIASTQNPAGVQKDVALMLGLPFNRVIVKTRRIGGGFGGKETKQILTSLPTAFAAHKLGRPVRLMLDRDEDMISSGNRHPFLFKYKLAITNEGFILGCDIEAFNNGGYSLEYSGLILERAVFHLLNCYKVKNVKITGTILKTNMPSNTAFRGFGAPQGQLCAEQMIRHVADAMKKSYLEIQRMHMYRDGDATYYGQILENYNQQRCYDEVIASSDFEKRRVAVEEFNSKNRWRKRGISVVNSMYGIGVFVNFANQAIASINVYRDGSIGLSHCGIEMGQGLHTKMVQVAATVLKVPVEKIYTYEPGTDKTPNSTSTCASFTSDLIGMAVVDACQQIIDRLEPIKERYPNETWEQWVIKAYMDRISLASSGYYKKPILGFNYETQSGPGHDYFVFGTAVSEVEIDCLTGNHQVIRTDIVMDVGSSLNPAIDIGQIEGAFMQGYGLFMMEELMHAPKGTLYSRGPGAYKIPGITDIPGEFNVSLLTGTGNPRAVFSSKGIGEPPLFLSASIFFAAKEAISEARVEEGLDPYFDMISPATCERIRLACQDKITKKVHSENDADITPWNIMP